MLALGIGFYCRIAGVAHLNNARDQARDDASRIEERTLHDLGGARGELPAPVSADLNGDGRPEVVVCEPVPGAGATRARLLVLSPALAGREGAGA